MRGIHVHRNETGQVLVLSVFLLIVVMGFVALAIDIGLFYEERRITQNAVDAGALAGAQELPDDGASAEDIARKWALNNEQGLKFDSLNVSFRCVVGDRNSDGQPDKSDVPAVCDPGLASFVCKGTRCASLCDASVKTNRCNTIVVTASKDVPFHFAPVLSIMDPSNKCIYSDCSTGVISGVACTGACGAPPDQPLDIVMILDRTTSMSATELQNAKNGALAALQVFNPQVQHVALGVLGPASSSDKCAASTSATSGSWLPVGFNNNYLNQGGGLNTGSQLVQTIKCLPNSSSVGTNLGDPTRTARQYLQANGRPGARPIILLFTDGAANQPTSSKPCAYASNEADLAEKSGIEVYTIGYGLEVEVCAETGSAYAGIRATTLLAAMATDSTDDHGGCTTAGGAMSENADGDHFLCQPTSGDLSTVFKQVAVQIVTSGSSLIGLPE